MTEQQKIAAFAAYGNRKIKTRYGIGNITSIQFIDRTISAEYNGGQYETSIEIEGCALILRDLRNIADEDVNYISDKMATKGLFEYVKEYCYAQRNRLPPMATDYLRSKGYNLPFMGFDLVKEGIAIIEQ